MYILETIHRVFFCKVFWFVGAFAKLRKATVSFVMSVCPSVIIFCP